MTWREKLARAAVVLSGLGGAAELADRGDYFTAGLVALSALAGTAVGWPADRERAKIVRELAESEDPVIKQSVGKLRDRARRVSNAPPMNGASGGER